LPGHAWRSEFRAIASGSRSETVPSLTLLAAESRQVVSDHSRHHWLAGFDSGRQEKYNASYIALVAGAKDDEPTLYAD